MDNGYNTFKKIEKHTFGSALWKRITGPAKDIWVDMWKPWSSDRGIWARALRTPILAITLPIGILRFAFHFTVGFFFNVIDLVTKASDDHDLFSHSQSSQTQEDVSTFYALDRADHSFCATDSFGELFRQIDKKIPSVCDAARTVLGDGPAVVRFV